MEQHDPPAKVASNDQLGLTLKPCPFCGGEAMFTVEQRENHPDFGGHSAMCGTCGAGIGYVFACMDDPRPLLTEQWNKRTQDAEAIKSERRALVFGGIVFDRETVKHEEFRAAHPVPGV